MLLINLLSINEILLREEENIKNFSFICSKNLLEMRKFFLFSIIMALESLPILILLFYYSIFN